MLSAPGASGKTSAFGQRVVAWQKRHGRHELPWQASRNAYPIWLAEVMLQQTQVATVIPYFRRFLARFPDVAALAAAPIDEVMTLWSGLGYYARARHLHQAAREVVRRGGRFPDDARELARLPGVGRSTAAAIAVFAWGRREAILDGNVKRVLTRSFGIEGFPGARKVEQRLWRLAEDLLPRAQVEAYTQGLMDLGATLCTRANPDCPACPLADICVAKREGRTAELPSPRPSRKLPQRERVVLVILHDGRVLIEQRPPAGIWGALVSLPELDATTIDVAAAIAEICGARPASLSALDPVTHAFTHFVLRMQPLLARVEPPFKLARSAACRWQPVDSLAAVALPAPIRRLLLTLLPDRSLASR